MYARVIPLRRTPLALQLLDYTVPTELESLVTVGQLVAIPFASQNIKGVIFSLNTPPPAKVVKLKSIISLDCVKPLIANRQLAFFYNLALIYATPLGFILKNSLPSLAKKNLSILNDSEFKKTKQDNLSLKNNVQIGIYNGWGEKKTLINKLISADSQTLIIVPEIYQISEFKKILNAKNNKLVVIIRPQMGAKEYFTCWRALWQSENLIIIGTRRALFLPFTNLTNIIIDDEGNINHKSWDMAPRFNAKDASALLAKEFNANLNLISHTPSVESYKNIKLNFPNLLNSIKPQPYQIINLSEEKLAKNYNILSTELTDEIKDNNIGVTFLYLNKLGSSHYLSCKDCANILTCPNCQVTYTYYEENHTLRCHRCQKSLTFSPLCKKCGGTNTTMNGPGINALQKEVEMLLKNTGRKIQVIEKSGEKIEIKFLPGLVIIGTQFAWARVNWQKTNLFALVDADTSLFIPEYKITEQLWQLLGSANFKLPTLAKKYIQTNYPESKIFTALYHPELFYQGELAQRKLFNLPPYSLLVKLTYEDANQAKTEATAASLYRQLISLTKNDSNIKILTNHPLFPYWLRDKFAQAILAKIKYKLDDNQVKNFISLAPATWKVDINPINIIARN